MLITRRKTHPQTAGIRHCRREGQPVDGVCMATDSTAFGEKSTPVTDRLQVPPDIGGARRRCPLPGRPSLSYRSRQQHDDRAECSSVRARPPGLQFQQLGPANPYAETHNSRTTSSGARMLPVLVQRFQTIAVATARIGDRNTNFASMSVTVYAVSVI